MSLYLMLVQSFAKANIILTEFLKVQRINRPRPQGIGIYRYDTFLHSLESTTDVFLVDLHF